MSQDDAAARRARLLERQSRLSGGQREQLEQRLKGHADPSLALAPSGRCLVEIVPVSPGAREAGRRPFFCIHPAGGDVLCFFPLARHLGADQPFYGLQARGLEDAQEPFATIEEMAAHYVEEIRSVQPAGPYRLGGWSFGGLAAFELARQLQAGGEEVELLAVLDTSPGLAGAAEEGPRELEEDGGDNAEWLLAIAEYVKLLRGQDLAVTAADLRTLDPEAQLRHFVERLRQAGVLHGGDTLEQLRRLLRVYKTNVRAYRLYIPRPTPGPVTLLLAEQGALDSSLGPDLGWDRLSPFPVDRETVPGDHHTLLVEPHVRTLADRLRARLGLPERS
jgi:thioesterase domain-containing protein